MKPETNRLQSTFSRPLLKWYRHNRRDLPWRKTRDPYAILVSEIMLQQTQVKTVLPYYLRWMKQYPTVHTLATASETDVLKSWEGLGYYQRACFLRAAAKQIVFRHNGHFPKSVENIRALPGVGPYTLGAVASIAFGLPLPVLDGNVIRVLCRWFGIQENTCLVSTRKNLWKLAETLIPLKTQSLRPETVTTIAGDFNQGMMELGATICIPRKPFCSLCPIHNGCQAFVRGIQQELPRMAPRQPIIQQFEYAGLVIHNKQVLLYHRLKNQRLASLWQFPSVTLSKPSISWRKSWKQSFGSFRRISRLATFSYSITNHRIRLKLFKIYGFRKRTLPGSCWVSPSSVKKLALTAAHRKLANQFL